MSMVGYATFEGIFYAESLTSGAPWHRVDLERCWRYLERLQECHGLDCRVINVTPFSAAQRLPPPSFSRVLDLHPYALERALV